MTEADEVAVPIFDQLPAGHMLWTRTRFRVHVGSLMPDESVQVIENVTEALYDMVCKTATLMETDELQKAFDVSYTQLAAAELALRFLRSKLYQ